MDEYQDEPIFRMARPEALRVVHLDSFTAIYHRTSGITHLITAPAPEIMAILGDAGMTRPALTAALAAHFDIADFDTAAVSARLDELVAAGLVSAA